MCKSVLCIGSMNLRGKKNKIKIKLYNEKEKRMRVRESLSGYLLFSKISAVDIFDFDV